MRPRADEGVTQCSVAAEVGQQESCEREEVHSTDTARAWLQPSPLLPSLSGTFRGKFGTDANNTEKMAAAFS